MEINRRDWFFSAFGAIAAFFGYKATCPWKEISKAEVYTSRLGANNLKGAQLMSDYDILTKWLKYTDTDAKTAIAILQSQKLQDLKLQILAQNPSITGIKL